MVNDTTFERSHARNRSGQRVTINRRITRRYIVPLLFLFETQAQDRFTEREKERESTAGISSHSPLWTVEKRAYISVRSGGQVQWNGKKISTNSTRWNPLD